MPDRVSVIIAARNEEGRVEQAVRSAFAAGAAEVIVADGSSEDETAARAARAGATVIPGPPHRALQYNAAAAQAGGEHLIFLHADSTLPLGAAEAVVQARARGILFGGFRLRFAEASWRLRLAERLINLRCLITRSPWGDQGQFIGRADFLRAGGYRSLPLMEDYDLALRMKRSGRTAILELPVTTSGRRFLEKGLLRTAWVNWTTILLWRLGAGPQRLAARYRR